MSHHRQSSAHIPPPTDYSSRSRPSHGGRYRDRGGRGNRGRDRNREHFHHRTSSNQQLDQNDEDQAKTNPQPKDRFHRNDDDDYFEAVEEEVDNELVEDNNKNIDNKYDEEEVEEDEDEDDPLEAYMKSLESADTKDKKTKVDNKLTEKTSEHPAQHKQLSQSISSTESDHKRKAIRLDIEDTDDTEDSYYQYLAKGSGVSTSTESKDYSDDRHDLVEYDKDGNILSVGKVKKDIEPLPTIDHSKIVYDNFQRVFYKEHPEIEKLSQEQSENLRSKLDIKVSGDSPPKPVCSFAHFNFDEQLMKVIRRSQYTQPTPIQAQAIPAALLGRNIIGVAMTGSGKTAAYLWPMIVHIMGQPDLKPGDGPIGLVLVPTRELALQVYGEAKKFSKSYRMAVVCAYGGGSKYEQTQDLVAGAEIVVATPGRLIDLIKLKATNLTRVTYLVLDEADRFFDMGFEAQVRSICDQVRPDRQILLFSATFKKSIEHLARSVIENPIRIVQKALGEANEDVTQHVIVLPNRSKKWDWLMSRLVEFTSSGSVIIFVSRIINSEELNKNLNEFGKETLLLHGDMEQAERNRVITSFKHKEREIMVATDVAARGLDISHIRTVINYDVARDIDTHTHRIGRTGRAGTKGDAYTLVASDTDKEFAGNLIKNLRSSNQTVPNELLKLAMQSKSYRKSHRDESERGGKRARSYHHHHSEYVRKR